MSACVLGNGNHLVGLLEVYHHGIPRLTHGIAPVVVGGVLLLLLKTLNVELQDHIEANTMSNIESNFNIYYIIII